MCHHVGGWEKVRLSSPSQSGGDMWQCEISFLFKCLDYHKLHYDPTILKLYLLTINL
jgi:hypothetical protein